jgi:hypothetical protein
MIELDNPITDIYKELGEKFGIIKIPEGEFDKAVDRVNENMERFSREVNYQIGLSIYWYTKPF